MSDRVNQSLLIMRNRGPDDRGYQVHSDDVGTVVLGHTRLSIIDLSSGGHQPMRSDDERCEIVFNGEIYNYKEIRAELISSGSAFRTESDTEVLLKAWQVWGKECLRKLRGMFAFVVYDKVAQSIFCARDGFGIKPLYYSANDRSLVISSDAKAIFALSGTEPKLDVQRSYDYLVHSDYDSSHRTFFDGVLHLPPGECFEVKPFECNEVRPVKWWSPRFDCIGNISFDEAASRFRELFLRSVRLHLRGDVPLGVALSGGVDSSSVVCAVRYLEPQATIKTFSYIAGESGLSEEVWVDRINNHVAAESYKTKAGPDDLMRDLDDLIRSQGEPFNSTSIYAQYRVFKLARENGVTITLDGQGADELLAGYSGYPGYRLQSIMETGGILAAHNFIKQWSKWPGRSYGLALMEYGKNIFPDTLYSASRQFIGRDFRPDWLNVRSLHDRGVVFAEARDLFDSGNRGRRVMERLARSLQDRGLPALLRHADRNSMRFSVESRVPFLINDIADLSLSFPENFLIADSGETKSVFRRAMRGIVPDEVLERRDKIGFATPERNWLLANAPIFRRWISDSESLPSFINTGRLLDRFDNIVKGKIRFTGQFWRWINFVRWVQIMGIKGD